MYLKRLLIPLFLVALCGCTGQRRPNAADQAPRTRGAWVVLEGPSTEPEERVDCRWVYREKDGTYSYETADGKLFRTAGTAIRRTSPLRATKPLLYLPPGPFT